MDPQSKFKKVSHEEKDAAKLARLNKCNVCGKRFKSRSHYDVLCDLCWADNEMRPYFTFGGIRRSGMVS